MLNSLSYQLVALWTQQLSQLLSSGLTLRDALNVLAVATSNKKLCAICNGLLGKLEQGSSLSQSLSKYPKYFESFYCAMVDLGEQSGQVPLFLEQLALEKLGRIAIQRKIAKALRYPLFVLAMSLLVSFIMVLAVFPEFQNLFAQSGQQLPSFTQQVFNVVNFIQHYYWLIIATVLLLPVLLVMVLRASDRGRYVVDLLLRFLPLSGGIKRRKELLYCARMLALALAAKINLLIAIKQVEAALFNSLQAQRLNCCARFLKQGMPYGEALRRSKCFPHHLVYLLEVGGERGQLAQAMRQVSNTLEQELDGKLERVLSYLEPITMLIIGLIIGSLIVALYLPIVQIGGVL